MALLGLFDAVSTGHTTFEAHPYWARHCACAVDLYELVATLYVHKATSITAEAEGSAVASRTGPAGVSSFLWRMLDPAGASGTA